MDKLRSFYNSLSQDERAKLLEAIPTSEGYLRKAMCTGMGPYMAIRIERATNGALTREDLRPDIFTRDGNAA